MAAILEVRLAEPVWFQLGPGVVRIGRGPENEIQISDPSVSGKHCEITITPGGTLIRDLDSTNGTCVSGQRVESGVLNWDEPFRLGDVECVVHPGESQARPCSETIQPPSKRRWSRIDREGWRALAIGVGLAVGVCMVPLLVYIVDFLRVIIHETGHTVTAWAFGYLTIPMLRPGGGVSASVARPPLMVLSILALLGKLLYDAYRTKRHVLALTVGIGVYLLFALTGLRRLLISAMGHGAELLVASLFLYRAISGQSILVRAERPLYATIALMIFGLDVRFAFGLLGGGEAEVDYREGFDGNTHDLVRIAEEYLHVELKAVVLVYLVLCLAAPCAVFLYYACFGSRTGRRGIAGAKS